VGTGEGLSDLLCGRGNDVSYTWAPARTAAMVGSATIASTQGLVPISSTANPAMISLTAASVAHMSARPVRVTEA
jgi:hypothetical protein